jgi:hemolysin D
MRRSIAYRQVSMKSANINDRAASRPKARGRDELAFLPAAIEIAETPPPPLAGAVGATIIALFCGSVLWASLGRVDIIAAAPGKIVSSGRTKTIQPFETGVVRAIRVADGQSVKAGDVLIELDPTINQADSQHLQGDLVAAELDVARLTAALGAGPDPAAAFAPPKGANAAQIAVQRQFLMQQLDEHRAKLAALERQKAQKDAEFATIASAVKKLEAVIPVLRERVEIRQILFSHMTGSKANYLELYQALVETQQELLVQKSRIQEAEAAIAAIVQARAQAEAEYRRTLFSELAEAQRKAAGLREDLNKAAQKTRLQVLTAPVDGAVQQLAVHTVGGVVTPGQALLAVAPSDSHLEIEAMISNRDIGFVHPGQEAEIKIDTFNFTRYGLIRGRVMSVSQDAIVRDKRPYKAGDAATGGEGGASEPKDQELVYAALVSLDRTKMQVEENLVNLSAGMAATVEVKTGARRIIDYLLSPLLKYSQESLRER